MSPKQFPSIFMDEVAALANLREDALWLWEGYVARSNVTVLTSQWKTGKTTLLSGLVRQMEHGGTFLGQKCGPAQVLIISEEGPIQWAPRLAFMPIGRHVRLMPRPFVRRPTPELWLQLLAEVEEQVAAKELDVVVVDSLAAFLPTGHENDAGLLLDMIQPLQRIAAAGAAVLILHHPRKQTSAEGHSARGSGALLGFVDIILELHRYGRLQSDDRKRKLVALSRFVESPRHLIYEWNPDNGAFGVVDDIYDLRFRENWHILRTILGQREDAVSHRELMADWPADQTAPPHSVMYEWLKRAYAQNLVRREGRGTRTKPYRYRLPNADDVYRDGGELPPLGELAGARTDQIMGQRRNKKRRSSTDH